MQEVRGSSPRATTPIIELLFRDVGAVDGSGTTTAAAPTETLMILA